MTAMISLSGAILIPFFAIFTHSNQFIIYVNNYSPHRNFTSITRHPCQFQGVIHPFSML
jgi:hypothetical protein